MDLADSTDYRVSFETIQCLRNIQDRLLLISVLLNTSVNIVRGLTALSGNNKGLGGTKASLADMRSSLACWSSRLRGDLKSADVLQDRIQAITHLVSSPKKRKDILTVQFSRNDTNQN